MFTVKVDKGPNGAINTRVDMYSEQEEIPLSETVILVDLLMSFLSSEELKIKVV